MFLELRRRTAPLAALALLLTAAGCGDDGGDDRDTGAAEPDTALAADGLVRLTISLPYDAAPTLVAAAGDVIDAVAAITGAAVEGERIVIAQEVAAPAIVVRELQSEASPEPYGPEGYTLEFDAGVVTVTAAEAVGAMYGLYAIAGDLGARYHHPEETWFPSDPDLALPDGYDGSVSIPAFAWRGFHEHTQHPIEMSDFLLRPEAEFRPYLSRYIRWLARNRQNTMSWQMLKTVELDAWLPYIADVIDEAHDWGVRVGMVTSFVDQQQNMFRLIRAEEDERDDETQIREGLAQLLDAARFDFIVTQIGSSEFTKPDDADVLRWIAVASEVLAARGVRYWTWIHTTCDLESEDGGYFYHLPLQADANVGAWLHTTMFHNLRDPAPVYSCEDFSHQREFGDAADGERSLVYFPETAWWLGFDNNMPLVLPLTGASREVDIREVLPAWDVEGHVTFTTGREWTYWQYDHFLTRATWDRDFGWDAYLAWIAPMYGQHAEAARAALSAWTDLQERDFFDADPLLYFYLAGELRQDEIGARAGILARRPKLAFADVVAMDEAAYTAWRRGEFAALRAMRTDYGAVFDAMPPRAERPGTLSETLYAELHDALYVYVRRIDHVVALYGALDAVRTWAQHEEGDGADRDALLAEAEAGLAEVRAISAEMMALFGAAESRYRFPIQLLAREKPETLTAYPYGYVWQVSTAHFWTRRDEQLDALVGTVFGTAQDHWATDAPDRLWISDSDHTDLLVPDHPLASSVITGFVPQTLFGVDDPDGAPALSLALDFNANLLPDPGTETHFVTRAVDGGLDGSADAFTLEVYSVAGERYGEVNVLDAALELRWDGDAETSAELGGEVPSSEMVGLVVSVGGIDEQGAANLVKSVFGFAPSEPIPARLPIRFRFTLRAP